MTDTMALLPEPQRGPAEQLLDLVLSSSAHLWHNRPGVDVGGVWRPAPRGTPPTRRIAPGLHVPAAVALYSRLLDIRQLNQELAARFASYAMIETEWRDLKVACAALMLVQPRSGQPFRDEGGSVEFYDDDYRGIGEAMILFYEKKSRRMMTPRGVLRVAQLLETPAIARLNRRAGFASPGGRKPPVGRWPQAAQRWLRTREINTPLLEGLVKAGYKETIKSLARKCGYRPAGPAFFEILGWKQKQSPAGHRRVGLDGLNVQRRERFDGLSEAEICEWIELEKLGYKDVVGRLPKEVGLTPAIMAACIPSLSDRELRILTPTLESLGLFADDGIRARWEKAVRSATDQRALNVAKNVRTQEIRESLEAAADHAARRAVEEATRDQDVRVMFLIDKSGSMEGAIEQSKEALSRILAGFPLDKVHIATFDTMGTVLRPKAASRAAVQHMLSGIAAGGGTQHSAAVLAQSPWSWCVPGASPVSTSAGCPKARSTTMSSIASTPRRVGVGCSCARRCPSAPCSRRSGADADRLLWGRGGRLDRCHALPRAGSGAGVRGLRPRRIEEPVGPGVREGVSRQEQGRGAQAAARDVLRGEERGVPRAAGRGERGGPLRLDRPGRRLFRQRSRPHGPSSLGARHGPAPGARCAVRGRLVRSRPVDQPLRSGRRKPGRPGDLRRR
jgi:hypothetical protein